MGQRKRIRTENNIKRTGCFYYESADGEDRTYYCTYKVNGNQITAKCGKKSQGYTLTKASHHRVALIQGKVDTPQMMREAEKKAEQHRIGNLYQWYLKKKDGKGRDDCNFNKYILPYWKTTNLQKCTNKDAERYAAWLKKKYPHLAPQTWKHILGLFRRIVLFAGKKMDDFNTRITCFYLPTVDNRVTELLNDEEYNKLLHVLTTEKTNKAVADMMLLIICTGMRQNEVCSLMWKDINFKSNQISIREAKGYKITGKNKILHIPMNNTAKKIVSRQPMRGKDMHIFPNKEGGKRFRINKQARRLADLAELPKGFRPCHGLRHVFGTQLAERGVKLEVISKMLGHSDIATTMRYIEITDKRQNEASDLMNIIGL